MPIKTRSILNFVALPFLFWSCWVSYRAASLVFNTCLGKVLVLRITDRILYARDGVVDGFDGKCIIKESKQEGI
jgi:hypothetical protein